MERPDKNSKKYYHGHMFLDGNYNDDQDKYIDQIEEESEDVSDFIKFVISKNDDLINDFSLIAYGAEYRTNNHVED